MNQKTLYLLLIVLGVFSLSCKKDGASYLGTWNVELDGGHRSLESIQSITIDESTITIHIKKTDEFDEMYNRYGATHSVSYTYKANDEDEGGNEGASFTCSSPLYFVAYSGGKDDWDYVSKVFIEMEGKKHAQLWDNGATHFFYLTKE